MVSPVGIGPTTGAVRKHGVDGLKWRDAAAASSFLELIRRDASLREHPSAQWVMDALNRRQGDPLAALRSAQYAHTPAAARLMPEIRAELLKTVSMLPPDVRLLRYNSQYEPSYQRQLDMADKLRKRVGGDNGAFDGEPFPPKPRWMRWSTYRRLQARYDQLNDLWAAGVMQACAIR